MWEHSYHKPIWDVPRDINVHSPAHRRSGALFTKTLDGIEREKLLERSSRFVAKKETVEERVHEVQY